MLPSALLVAAFTVHPVVDPPEAAFALTDGRLVVRVTHAGRPLGGVTVRCLVGREMWATADTDADGRASVPRPPKDWCQVVCDLGAGPTAPIPLAVLSDDEVVPKSFPVRDGAADCCMPPRRPPAEMPPPARPGQNVSPELLGLGLGTLLTGLACVVWRWRAARRST